MGHLPRTAVEVRPRAPYALWASALGGEPLPVEELERYRSIYLVDDEPDPSPEALVCAAYAEIFEYELFAWSEDRGTWPKPRTWAMFQEWFDVEVIESVVDLDGSGPGDE